MYSLAENILIVGFAGWLIRTWLFGPVVEAIIITFIGGDIFAMLLGGQLRENLVEHPIQTWVILGFLSALPYLALFRHLRRFICTRREKAPDQIAIK